MTSDNDMHYADANADLDEAEESAGALFAEEPDVAEPRPPWLVDAPPKRSKAKWPSGARSPTWIKLLLQCPARHSFRYRDRKKDPPGFEARVGNVVHAALDVAAQRRIRGRYKGLPRAASTEELLNLVEHFEEARTDPLVLTRAREILIGLGAVSFANAVESEALVRYRVTPTLLLAGYVDLVDVFGHPHDPDEVLITDYKTGPGQFPSDEELYHDPQVGLYLTATRERFPRAKRIQFRLWNVAQREHRILTWSRHLQEDFLAMARAARNTWEGRVKAPVHGTHCSHCPYRENCTSYSDYLNSVKMRGLQSDLSKLPIEQLMAVHREAAVVASMAEQRKSDAAARIMEKLGPDQKSYRGQRLMVTKARKSYTNWDHQGDVLADLAKIAKVPLTELVTELTKGIGSQKIQSWVRALPLGQRETAEAVIAERSRKGYSGAYLQVREIKNRKRPF